MQLYSDDSSDSIGTPAPPQPKHGRFRIKAKAAWRRIHSTLASTSISRGRQDARTTGANRLTGRLNRLLGRATRFGHREQQSDNITAPRCSTPVVHIEPIPSPTSYTTDPDPSSVVAERGTPVSSDRPIAGSDQATRRTASDPQVDSLRLSSTTTSNSPQVSEQFSSSPASQLSDLEAVGSWTAGPAPDEVAEHLELSSEGSGLA